MRKITLLTFEHSNVDKGKMVTIETGSTLPHYNFSRRTTLPLSYVKNFERSLKFFLDWGNNGYG